MKLVVTDAAIEVVGKALYMYWDDVAKSVKQTYSGKVRKALEAAIPLLAVEEEVLAEA